MDCEKSRWTPMIFNPAAGFTTEAGANDAPDQF
jgi:hypothetical protein